MTWLHENKNYDPKLEDLDSKVVYGFVYLIEDIENGRLYIGKKVMFYKGFRMKNKKKKRVLVESDWRTYHGSNKELSARVEELGPDKFKRTILHLCQNKAACSYLEMYEQVVRKVILDERYYNQLIRCRVTGRQLKCLNDYVF